MRKIKEVLRLKYDSNLSEREISRSCQVSRSTVADYLMKAKAVGISWPEAAALTDTEIEERLFPVQRIPSSVKRPEPEYEDYSYTINVMGDQTSPVIEFLGSYMVITSSGGTTSRSVEGYTPAEYTVRGQIVSCAFQKTGESRIEQTYEEARHQGFQ